jgi:hypothetical protein
MIDKDQAESELRGLKTGNEKIGNLVERLRARNVPDLCIVSALTLHAARIATGALGTTKAAEMFEGVASVVRNDSPTMAH